MWFESKLNRSFGVQILEGGGVDVYKDGLGLSFIEDFRISIRVSLYQEGQTHF